MKSTMNIFAPALITALCFVAITCKDMGEEIGYSDAPLSSSQTSVQLSPGTSATIQISGGELPYGILEAPDGSLATANFVNPGISPAELIISVPSTVTIGGTTQVRIGHDHDSDIPAGAILHDDDITISIVVSLTPPLVATPSSVSVGPGQSRNVLIENGTPPYIIVEAPSAGLATASFINANANPATLVITGVTIASAAGSTSVKVKDSSPSPEREVRVTITKTP